METIAQIQSYMERKLELLNRQVEICEALKSAEASAQRDLVMEWLHWRQVEKEYDRVLSKLLKTQLNP